MKRIIFALGILFVFATCKKTETTTTPPVPIVQEEAIKFTTNLDTGTYNVADTLPLTISVSSKLPNAGVIYSITATWTDSSKQIYKLDTNLNNSNLSLNIPGLKKAGNYLLSIIVTSKSTSTNSFNKSITIVNNPVARFNGYKVASDARQLGTKYWDNVSVPLDFMIYKFQTPAAGLDHIGNAANVVAGDFNKDGWIDIFAPGMAYSGRIDVNTSFLIWNPTKKIFEDKNLFNDKTINIAKTNPPRTVPVYINDDDYVDIVVFGYVDEGIPCDKPNPIMIVISDGKGGYDLINCKTESPTFYHNGGDVGDLNGDMIPDLVINQGGLMKIIWGTKNLPYFDESNSATFTIPINNLCGGEIVRYKNDNGFGESCAECIADYISNCRIYDINKDGNNDIVLGGRDNNLSPSRVLINQGKGRFNSNSIVKLPINITPNIETHNLDYVFDDINNDGLIDIIGLNVNWNYSKWNLILYTQLKDGTFFLDNTNSTFTRDVNKNVSNQKLIHVDINGDGQKDILYIEEYNSNQLKDKTVFIKNGNKFTETPFFQFDPYAKSLIK